MSNVMKTSPAVFAVGNTYQIMIPVTGISLMWVRIGDDCYYDDSNGIIRSAVTTHRITVPAEKLDSECRYTVCYRVVTDRKPYFSDTDKVTEVEYSFRPIKPGKVIAYHISDAHNDVDGPVSAAKLFEKETGALDLLILNGDIPNHSGDVSYFDTIYEIASQITHGSIPVIFSRGNHDTRGIYAEKLADYTPVQNGNSYFTFRLGGIWGIVLDCGEDKSDTHPEYGNTICCHEFRKRQTAFLKSIISNSATEYEADGVEHRIVISHIPFYRKFNPPFDIEKDIYTEWCSLLGEHVHPEVMIHGHEHILSVDMPNCEVDVRGLPCPAVIGSIPILNNVKLFIGAGYVFTDSEIEITFNDGEKIFEKHTLPL